MCVILMRANLAENVILMRAKLSEDLLFNAAENFVDRTSTT